MKFDVYTDGACSGNGQENAVAAYAYVVVNGYNVTTKTGLVLPATNGRAELNSIVAFLESVKKPNNDFVIYTDSKYIADAINNRRVREWKAAGWKLANKHDVANVDLWQRYVNNIVRLYESGCTVKVEKVAGHSGNQYNEIADSAAKDAVKAAKLDHAEEAI